MTRRVHSTFAVGALALVAQEAEADPQPEIAPEPPRPDGPYPISLIPRAEIEHIAAIACTSVETVERELRWLAARHPDIESNALVALIRREAARFAEEQQVPVTVGGERVRDELAATDHGNRHERRKAAARRRRSG